MIHTLYARVLFGFTVIIVLGIIGISLTASLLFTQQASPAEFVEMTLEMHLESAVELYERNDVIALSAFLQRLDRVYRCKHHLLDGNNRDLLDGSNQSILIHESVPYPSLDREKMILVRTSADSKYRLLVLVGPVGFTTAAPYFLWIPGLMGLACLLLTRRLIRPLRRLQRAVEEFGRGELASRSGVNDRSEFGQLAEAFDRMAEKIETLVVAERRLLQDVSHELRSPLARLAFAVEIAETSPDRPAAFVRVRKEIQRLTDLVAELIELTRLEGDPTRSNEPVDLTELIREVAEDCLIEADAKGCRIETELEADLLVTGEAGLLWRAVENVLRNAIRYAPADSSIQLRLWVESNRAWIEIRDRGPGVPEESLEAIFDPFFRVEADRGRSMNGGVGLGLSIAARAIRFHGGQIRAINAHPGLRVQIDLPLLPDEDALDSFGE